MKKKLFLILNLIVITFMANAQIAFDVPPHAIPYQGVARNASGSILALQNISLRISIHDYSAAGAIVFSEIHYVTTTSLGLFNLNIGSGTPITGTLLGVDWGISAKFIQVEFDPAGGNNFTDMGTTAFNSVPYALYAGKTASLPDGGADGNTLRWTGSSWLPNDIIHNSGAYIGIGTTDPQAKLDINGDIAMRSADITILAAQNYALDLYVVKQSNYKLLQSLPAVGNFVISGIQGGTEGRIVTLANRSGFSMQIYNDEPFASPAHRIITGTGTTFTVYNGGAVTLRYDAAAQHWEVISSHYNSLDYLGGGSYWNLSGSDISNNNAGNVGIKINNPTASLSVGRGSGTDGTAAFLGTTHISHFNYSSAEDTYIRGGKNGSKVIINDGALLGNVGIGLNNPRCRLSILSNTVMANSNTEVLQILGKNAMAIFSDQNGSDYGYIKAVTDNTQTPDFSRAGLLMGVSTGNLYLSTNYAPIITINGLTNNVGIGTVNPTQKLSVNGTIRSKEVIVETGWADYVFDEKYQLPDLDSVEASIKLNKHLPGIPSAKEIETNGLKVGEIETKMMEKIEELTLYVIGLKKEIELLKAKK